MHKYTPLSFLLVGLSLAVAVPSSVGRERLTTVPGEHSNPPSYYTDFPALPDGWTQDVGCDHCTKRGGLECTSMIVNATTFGSIEGGKGLIHATSWASSTACTACNVTSGHLTWNPALLYGNVTVVARWFPGPTADVQSATGFIGLDSPDNVASLTQGFHGAGCPKGGPWPLGYQIGGYANVNRSHHQRDVSTAVSVADTYNVYTVVWEKGRVTWYFNGVLVDSMTKAEDVPAVPMYLRLHSRSGWNNVLPRSPQPAFQAFIKSFSYTPP